MAAARRMGTNESVRTARRVFMSKILARIVPGGKGSSEIHGALERASLGVDFPLELEDGVKKRFGTRRAAGNVNINGDHLVAALDNGIIVENAAGSGASAHGDNPLGLGHLIVKLADHRCHFLRDAAGDN